jgi:phosphorylcholine metabolism protein LicD
MNYIAKYFELHYKHYWLSGGTLLGWYRDCGLISYSDDVDFNAWASEYDDKIKNFFLGNKRLHLWLELGKPAENFEFRLSSIDYTYDIFFTYKYPLNESVQWCSYQNEKSVYRYIFLFSLF